jgi:hypothetical protein
MAVVRVIPGEVHYYIGKTSDPKPTGVPYGSIFEDEDTGFKYKYGLNGWFKIITPTKEEAEEAAGS